MRPNEGRGLATGGGRGRKAASVARSLARPWMPGDATQRRKLRARRSVAAVNAGAARLDAETAGERTRSAGNRAGLTVGQMCPI